MESSNKDKVEQDKKKDGKLIINGLCCFVRGSYDFVFLTKIFIGAKISGKILSCNQLSAFADVCRLLSVVGTRQTYFRMSQLFSLFHV